MKARCYSRRVAVCCTEVTCVGRSGMRQCATVRSTAGRCSEVTGEERNVMTLRATAGVSRVASVRLLVRSALFCSPSVAGRCVEVSVEERIRMRLCATVRCVAGRCSEFTGEKENGLRLCATIGFSRISSVRLLVTSVV
jgi:hypothetical protein